MPSSKLAEIAQTTPGQVGRITLAIGAVLTLAPTKAGPPAGLGPAEARAFGIADLALVPGLLAGRDKALWMRARAALNVAMAGWYLAVVRKRHPSIARRTAAALGVLTVADSVVASQLRRTT